MIGDFGGDNLGDERGRTPLQTLILDECYITPTGLRTILSLPRNLVSLSLRETDRHLGHGGSKLNEDIGIVLSALSQQSHSLHFFQHSCPGFFEHRPQSIRELRAAWEQLERYARAANDSPGFSKFAQLRTLELSWLSVLAHILSNPALAPPALETYRLMELDYGYEGNWEHMPAHISAVASATPFKCLELHTLPCHAHPSRLSRTFMLESRAKKLIEVARIVKSRNATTALVSYETNFGTIPPYLYCEEQPKSKVCFESERFWKEEEKYAKLVAEGKHEDRLGEEEGPGDDGTVLAARIITGYRCLGLAELA